MTIPSLKEITRSPTGGLALGLAISFVLASLASAGLNTLWVARSLLLTCFCTVAAYVSLSDRAAKMTWHEKTVALFGAAAIIVGVERLETTLQPKPPPIPHLPQPPLMLLLRPDDIYKQRQFAQLPNLDVATTYLSRPQGGFAGFDSNNDVDDPMLAISHVDIANLSDHAITLSWELFVEGEGSSFAANGSVSCFLTPTTRSAT